MITAFIQGFGFAAGAIAAGLTFIITLGVWDCVSELAKIIIRLNKTPAVSNPGESLEGGDEPSRTRSI